MQHFPVEVAQIVDVRKKGGVSMPSISSDGTLATFSL
jgi:hypothetical protein